MMNETGSSECIETVLEQVLVELVSCVRRVPAASLARAAALIVDAPRIFVSGAGRSGLAMRALGMRLMHLGRTVYVVGETTTPGIGAGDLLIIGSGSGRTAVMLATAELAQNAGARILLFTTDETSPLARLADHRVIIPAPWFKESSNGSNLMSRQPMGTLFEQSLLLLGDSLILAMMRSSGVDEAQMAGRHDNLQ
jgi:6-phospho-3-hexuloisomerase